MSRDYSVLSVLPKYMFDSLPFLLDREYTGLIYLITLLLWLILFGSFPLLTFLTLS